MNDATKELLKARFWASKPPVDAINALLAARADVNARDCFGWTALHWAARFGLAETVNVLIEKGAAINGTDKDDSTPLHWAAAWGTAEVVIALIDAGADTTVRTKYGDTARELAQINPKLRGTDALKRLATQAMARKDSKTSRSR